MSTLAKLVDALERIDQRITNIEEHLMKVERQTRQVAAVMGEKTGELTMRGVLRARPEEIRNDFKKAEKFEMEVLEMDVEFSHAIFMGISPANSQKVRELLSKEQINYLSRVLEAHKTLEELAGWSEAFMKEAGYKLEEHKDEIARKVEHKLMSKVQGLAALEATMKNQQSKIDKALLRLNEAHKEYETSIARAGNIIKTGEQSSVRQNFSIGKKRGS